MQLHHRQTILIGVTNHTAVNIRLHNEVRLTNSSSPYKLTFHLIAIFCTIFLHKQNAIVVAYVS